MNFTVEELNVLEAKHKLFALDLIDAIQEMHNNPDFKEVSTEDIIDNLNVEAMLTRLGFTEKELKYQAISFMLNTVVESIKIARVKAALGNIFGGTFDELG
jgi:hypothetical protein